MSTHNLCFEQKHEKYQNFLSGNFHFLVVKFSVYLNRRVFVMGLCRVIYTTLSGLNCDLKSEQITANVQTAIFISNHLNETEGQEVSFTLRPDSS